MKKFNFKNLTILGMCCLLMAATLYIGLLSPPGKQTGTEPGSFETTAAATLGTTEVIMESSLAASAAAKASYSFSIDVNPSIELQVTEGLVTGAIAYNDDGQSLLIDISVIGLEADAAVRVIVTALIKDGYISDSELKPHLIVTVTNGGQAVGEEAVEALEKAAEEVLAGQSVECEVKTAYIPDEVAAAAAAYGLSAGRYVLLNYVAGVEAITVDEAIIKYGALKIGEMMEMFDGAKEAFKAYNKAAEGDDADAGDLEGMTPEQQAIFKAALDVFHVEMKAANDAFHQAFATIKSDTKLQIASARAAYRQGGKNDENYKESMTLLREGMLDARRQAIIAMKAAIKAAQAKFQAAVAALNLPGEEAAEQLDAIVATEIDTDEGLNDLLASFVIEPGIDDPNLGEEDEAAGEDAGKPDDRQKKDNKGQNKKP